MAKLLDEIVREYSQLVTNVSAISTSFIVGSITSLFTDDEIICFSGFMVGGVVGGFGMRYLNQQIQRKKKEKYGEIMYRLSESMGKSPEHSEKILDSCNRLFNRDIRDHKFNNSSYPDIYFVFNSTHCEVELKIEPRYFKSCLGLGYDDLLIGLRIAQERGLKFTPDPTTSESFSRANSFWGIVTKGTKEDLDSLYSRVVEAEELYKNYLLMSCLLHPRDVYKW